MKKYDLFLALMLTICLSIVFYSVAGQTQENSDLKRINLLNESKGDGAAPASANDINTQNSLPDKTSQPQSQTPLKKFGYAIAVAADFGAGLHEQADVRFKFDAGGAVGLEAQMRFVQLKHWRFGLNLGVMHFAHSPQKGTPDIRVTSKRNRFTSLASVEFYTKAFFVNGQLGAGFMILNAETRLIQNGVSSVSDNTGLNPGPMAGLETGVELGEHFFKWNREFRLALHSDWLRHDQRDELTVLMQLSFQLFSSFK